mgnify:CR=1 FL=1
MDVPQSLIESVSILNHSTHNLPPIPSCLSHSTLDPIHLKKKCHIYSSDQRKSCLKILESFNGNIKLAVQHIRKTPGYEKIEAKSLENWQKNFGNWTRTGGRKVNRDFDEEIKNMLIIHTLADVSSNLIYSTNVSAAFRYEDIKNAAEKVQLSPDWKLDPKIKDLKFSNHWVAKFLKRVNFSRKKVTSTTFIALSDVAVRETNEMIKGL